MATQEPLVLISGQVQRLPSGDDINGAVSNPAITLTNENAGAITVGQPVYSSSAGSADEARANAIGTSRVIGLVQDASIAAAASGVIQYAGKLLSADWTAVIGSTNLVAGTVYFLDPSNPGQLVSTAPDTSGQYLVRVGIALSTTELLIEIDRPVGL